MTVDPENIKAILATQFTEFGKGHDFHEAWKLVSLHPRQRLMVVSRRWDL